MNFLFGQADKYIIRHYLLLTDEHKKHQVWIAS